MMIDMENNAIKTLKRSSTFLLVIYDDLNMKNVTLVSEVGSRLQHAFKSENEQYELLLPS